MKVHELKSWPESFKAIKKGRKTCDLRLDDRNFQIGNIILFQEFNPGMGAGIGERDVQAHFTGETIGRIITHVQTGGLFGLEKEYVCLSLKRIK